VTSLERSATGKLFHASGPLTAKLLSPWVVLVRTRHVLAFLFLRKVRTEKAYQCDSTLH